jgi:hypothetical protein
LSGRIKASITLNAILATGNDVNRFVSTDAAAIEGRVIGVRMEGAESCNCDKTAHKDRLLHGVDQIHVAFRRQTKTRNSTFKSEQSRMAATETSKFSQPDG